MIIQWPTICLKIVVKLSFQGQLKYHTPDECEIFENNKDLLSSNVVDIIGVLLPLRLWLLKQRDPVLWKQVESMESHVDKRRNTPVWKDREENVIDVREPVHRLQRFFFIRFIHYLDISNLTFLLSFLFIYLHYILLSILQELGTLTWQTATSPEVTERRNLGWLFNDYSF